MQSFKFPVCSGDGKPNYVLEAVILLHSQHEHKFSGTWTGLLSFRLFLARQELTYNKMIQSQHSSAASHTAPYAKFCVLITSQRPYHMITERLGSSLIREFIRVLSTFYVVWLKCMEIGNRIQIDRHFVISSFQQIRIKDKVFPDKI